MHGFTLIKNEEGEMAGIFICDNSNQNMEMIQCAGLDDDTTCGAGIQCILSSCGRPLFTHIGITYAGSSDPFDSNAATSTKSFATILSLIYSLIPYILLALFSIQFLATGSVVVITRLGLMGFLSLVNDAILKNILKQPRPTGSCLYFHAYGMPSGHAATSIGLLTFMLLELLVYHPNLFVKRHATVTESRDLEEIKGEFQVGTQSNFVWGYGWQKQPNAIDSDDLEATILSPEPTGYHYLKSKWIYHYHALLWTTILLPVPLSRVQLHDHSPMQILAGSTVGIILGTIWYFCIIRGWIFRSGDANSKYIMECLVNSRFGKWFGLNLGESFRKVQMH